MIEYISNEIETPFQPANPVRPENFKGRKEVIHKIIRYTPNALKKEAQHFFLTGNKGMGKTSISDFVINYVQEEFNLACSYTSNKGNDSIEHLSTNILIQLLNNMPKESRLKRVKNWFGEHVSEVEFIGTKLRFTIDEDKQEKIKDDFVIYLNQAYEDLKKHYNGMFIVIDDINGLSKSREFVDWYKRLADTIIVDKHYQVPVYFLLIGYPEKFDNLVELESSFGRIFQYSHIGELTNEEVNDFYKDTFKSIDITIDEEALNLMTKYSSGVPLTMQQIGDSVFWNLTKNNISINDAKEGIKQAAFELKNRQIRRILNHIKSPEYENILLKLGKNKITSFTQEDIKALFSEKEIEIMPEFLNKMVNINLLKIIDEWDGIKEYEFTEKTTYTYYNIISSDEL